MKYGAVKGIVLVFKEKMKPSHNCGHLICGLKPYLFSWKPEQLEPKVLTDQVCDLSGVLQRVSYPALLNKGYILGMRALCCIDKRRAKDPCLLPGPLLLTTEKTRWFVKDKMGEGHFKFFVQGRGLCFNF